MSRVTNADTGHMNRNQTPFGLPGGSVLGRRRHLFEINDQPWFPSFFREMVQDVLTLGWINKFPLLQTISPAALAARVLYSVLGKRVSDYVYVDFASGAGGPIQYIEQELNARLYSEGKDDVHFVLSDISPHIGAWSKAVKKSGNLSYIGQSVDATNAPPARELLQDVPNVRGKKVMRLFNLAFHHFDDDLAAKVLENTIKTSDGFCIFELQSRNPSSLLLITLLGPLCLLIMPFYYPDVWHLVFTYIIPVIPFVWVFDGYISSLRTRTPDEVDTLLRSRVSSEELADWKFQSGQECHFWPLGWLYWTICYRR